MTAQQTVRWPRLFRLALFASVAVGSAAAPARADEPYADLASSSFKYADRDIRDAVLALSALPPAARDESRRFRLSYYLREWATVRDTLGRMPPATAARVYAKIVNDVSREREPMMAVDDYYGLLDACPALPDDALLRNLGDVARVVVRPEERGLLGTRLELGTPFFGGKDFTTRLNLGRIMLQAHFDDLARQFLPPVSALGQIANEPLHREILQFHKLQDELRDATPKEKRIEEVEREFAAVTAACFGNAESRRKAEYDLLPFFGQRLPHATVLDAVQTHLGGPGKELVPAYVARLAEIFEYYRTRNAAPVVRLNHLVLQAKLADLIAAQADLKAPPWNTVMVSLAGNWMAESAEMASKKEILEKTGKSDNFVSSGDLLATMPSGAWLKSLPEGLHDRVLVLQERVLMFANLWDEAFPKIVQIGRANPEAAALLTAECLERWARVHDPTIPEDVRKKFALAQSQIVVTPILAARNLVYYADIMALLRANHVPMRNMEYLLDVYEHSQGGTEPYRREDLDKVFGPVVDLDPASFLTLVTRLRTGLGDRWRKPASAQDNAAVLGLMRAGYAAALQMIDDWAARQPNDWKALREAAVMASDWADFEYFQELVKSPKPEALALYDAKDRISQGYFRRAAERDLKTAAQGVKLVETEETLFVTWFKHLMGIHPNGEVNLSKAPSALALREMRDLILSLPPDAAKAQMAALASYVDTMIGDPRALDPNLKFKFMQSSLLITAGSSFAEAVSNKVEYLETLLQGVRLEVSLDGPSTIWRKEDAGIVVSLRHTDVMGRQLNFASILGAAPPVKPADKARKMLAVDTVHNELESNILKALSPFFDVRSITLSPATVKSVPTQEPRWERTVLAYVVVRAFDVSVDKIPQLTLTLNFLDRSGPVALPVKSAEVMIRVSEQPPAPRPIADLRLTQTIDTRQLDTTGELQLAITAVGTGLLPRLEDLVDLQPLERSVTVGKVVPVELPLVREILDSNQVVSVTSERRWRIDLDGRKINRAGTKLPVYYPRPRDPAAVVRNDYYVDADLVGATNAFVLIGKGELPELVAGADGQLRAVDHTRLILSRAAAIAALLLLGLLLVIRVRRPASTVRTPQARDVFHLPDRMEPFIVVSLLRNLLASDLVHIREEQRRALTEEMQRVELACFRPGGAGMTEAELSSVAKKALKMCC